MRLLRFLQDCDCFVGSDKKVYPPHGRIKKDDLLTVPDENAKVLIGVGAAEEIALPDLPPCKKEDCPKVEASLAPDVKETMGKPIPELTKEQEAEALREIDRKDRELAARERLKRIGHTHITWDETKNRVDVDFPALANWICGELSTISFSGQVWINHEGTYMRDYGLIDALITNLFNAAGVRKGINSSVSELHARVSNNNPLKDYPFNTEPNLIPVANGILRLDDKTNKVELLPNEPKYLFNYRLPVRYDRNAPTEPVMEVLRSWVAPDDVRALIQFPAQAILQSQERVAYKRAYLFDGERDSGKSTYWLLCHAIFGDDQTGNIELGAIGENPFALADLEGKLINFYDDLGSFPIRFLGPFKKVTGNVWHRIERKNQQSYNGLITATHAFTCNGPPFLKDLFDDAFFSRWIYVVFPNSFAPDPIWPTRLFTPTFLSGFLNLIIKAILDIKKAGRLTFMMDSLEVRERWIYAVEPVQRFKNEMLLEVPGRWLSTEDVWVKWVDWCQRNKANPKTKTSLTQSLGRIGVHARQKESGKIRAYDGVTWAGGAPPTPQSTVTTSLPEWTWRENMDSNGPNMGYAKDDD